MANISGSVDSQNPQATVMRNQPANCGGVDFEIIGDFIRITEAGELRTTEDGALRLLE